MVACCCARHTDSSEEYHQRSSNRRNVDPDLHQRRRQAVLIRLVLTSPGIGPAPTFLRTTAHRITLPYTRSEHQLHRQLDLARAVGLPADDAEVALVDARRRRIELHAIERVEELGPELCVESVAV